MLAGIHSGRQNPFYTLPPSSRYDGAMGSAGLPPASTAGNPCVVVQRLYVAPVLGDKWDGMKVLPCGGVFMRRRDVRTMDLLPSRGWL